MFEFKPRRTGIGLKADSVMLRHSSSVVQACPAWTCVMRVQLIAQVMSIAFNNFLCHSDAATDDVLVLA